MERRRNRVGDARSRRSHAAWMGSVADYCIRTAAQPLMAIRPPAYRQDEAAGY